MIVVTTPTGQIGSQVLSQLVAAGEPVRAIARDPGRVGSGSAGRVELIQGSHGDPATLARALDGAEAIFWCIPPDFQAPDVREYYLGFNRSLVAALPGSSVRRVVFVSSGGRERSAGAGVVAISHEIERMLEATGVDLRSLRCGYFMENMLHQVEPIRRQGTFFGPIPGDYAFPVCATGDIATRAADLLRDRSWTGQGGSPVHGPADLSFDAMAGVVGRVLGRSVRYQEVPLPAYEASLVDHGASADIARNLAAMWQAIGAGLYAADPKTPEATTPTTFEAWAEATLKPAFA